MKPSIFFFLFLLSSFAFHVEESNAQNNGPDPIQNQHDELVQMIYALRNPNTSGELELTSEQQSKISSLHSRLDDSKRYFDDNTDQRNGDDSHRELYEKRYLEDLEIFNTKLNSDILLPHQAELLEKIQKRLKFEWHVNTNFTRIKGTELEGLDLSEQQLEKLVEIRKAMQNEYAEEQQRYQKKIQEIKDKAFAQMRATMTEKQRELLDLD